MKKWHVINSLISVVLLMVVGLLVVGTRIVLAESEIYVGKELTDNGNKMANGYAIATFAGGCFWCMQPAFDKVPGVVKTIVGYSGGKETDPTYEQVASGKTGHAESIRVTYDPAKVGYDKLVEVFWHTIDPTQVNGQFADHGPQYRTAIFYHNNEQRELAEKSKAALISSGKFSKPIVTEITPATDFYTAEEFHQGYYQKNSAHYKRYSVGSGRDGFIKQTWGAQEKQH